MSKLRKRNGGRTAIKKRTSEKQTAEKRTAGAVSIVFSVCAIVGAVAGAGFLSGRELLEFFGGFRVFPLAVAFAAFACGFGLFLSLGARFGGFDGVMRGVFRGAAAKATKAAALFCSFSVGAATLSALHAAYPQSKPFFAAAFVCIAALCTRRGIAGVSSFGAAFTPFLIAATLVLIAFRGCFSAPDRVDFLCGARSSFSAIVYACMNVFAVCPVLCDLGETLGLKFGKTLGEKRKIVATSLCSAGFLILLAAAILSAVGGDKCSYSKPLPLDYALGGGKFFALLSAIGMLTTFTACFYPVSQAARTVALRAWREGKNDSRAWRIAASQIAVAAAFLIISLLPFEKIVRYFYPIAGVFGAPVIFAAAMSAFGLKRRRVSIPR